MWKFATGPDQSPDLKEDLVAFLMRHQFEVAVLKERNYNMPIIRAISNDCRMEVVRAAPDGWDSDLLRGRGAAADHAFTIVRGRVYVDQPTWLTATYDVFSRLLRRLGLVSHTGPVLRVIAQRSCNAELLPWHELYEAGLL
jgi:hypothetical protein